MNKVHQIVIQPTSFCNINCKYCYLPDRDKLNQLNDNILGVLLSKLLDSNLLDKHIEFRWHSGEPLAINIEKYKQWINIIENSIGNSTLIRHTIQTNTLPINQAWCDFLKENKFEVGISIDGPQHIHDKNRVDKKGEGTFERVIEKIELLQKNKIDFSVIAVLTDYSLDFADEIYSFFSQIKPVSLGFNSEETEGINTSVSFAKDEYIDRYSNFMQRIFQLSRDKVLKIRELNEIKDSILFGVGDRENIMVKPFGILTINHNGDLFTYSPELSGYTEFCIGNILINDFDELQQQVTNSESSIFNKLNREIELGVQMCKNSCEYFSVCGGGAPSNKYYENGLFASTITNYCKARYIVPADIILTNLELENE